MEADGRVFGIFDDYFRRYTSLIDLRTVSYTHLRAHETVLDIVCRLLLEKKTKNKKKKKVKKKNNAQISDSTDMFERRTNSTQ